MIQFPDRLIELRTEKHLSQAVVAQAAQITTRTYQRYEAGEREPTVSTLVRMADFYGVSLDYLVGRTDRA